MIEIVAWAGAFFALIAGLGMIVAPHKAGNLRNPRLLGLFFLLLAAFNVYMATNLI